MLVLLVSEKNSEMSTVLLAFKFMWWHYYEIIISFIIVIKRFVVGRTNSVLAIIIGL